MKQKEISKKELKKMEAIIFEENDKRSQELFNKNYCKLAIGEIQLLEEYKEALKNPEWKIIQFNGKESNYEVSNTGMIRNRTTGKMLSGSLNEFGYRKINLVVNKKSCTMKVHRLVAIAFIPNPENKPEVNHITGVKACNWVGNLEWNTSKENKQHAITHGYYDNASFIKQGTDRPNARYNSSMINDVCKLIEAGFQPKEISEILGVERCLPTYIKYNGKWKVISSHYTIPKPRAFKNHRIRIQRKPEELSIILNQPDRCITDPYKNILEFN